MQARVQHVYNMHVHACYGAYVQHVQYVHACYGACVQWSPDNLKSGHPESGLLVLIRTLCSSQ